MKDCYKYGGTIMVIVNPISTSGINSSALPEELWEVNNMPLKDQWTMLESMRDTTGGIVCVTPNPESAFRELLNDFLDRDGFMIFTGARNVHTKEHGDFHVILAPCHARTDLLGMDDEESRLETLMKPFKREFTGSYDYKKTKGVR